jgi:hypothetical protein
MPAGSTYTPIATTTLGSAQTEITFSSISGSYTDLILILNGIGAVLDGYSVLAQVGNGSVDTGSNYSGTRLSGSGSAASSGRFTNQTYLRFQSVAGQSTTAGNLTNIIAHFMNYSNTTTNKTILNRSDQPAGSFPATEALVGLWRSTAAINTIKVFPFTGASFATGSTFTLYGIASA